MEFVQSIILGIVQGITEFLPISSSAHLAIIPQLFGWKEQSTYFDIVLHGGTLAAIVLYFRNDLYSIGKNLALKDRNTIKLIINIGLSTLPALIFGYLLQDLIDVKLKSLWVIATSMILIAILMIFVEKHFKNNDLKVSDLKYKPALIVGLAQTLALVRGVSRSGITIITSIMLGLKREEAARYSFLISIPVLSITFLYALYSVVKNPVEDESILMLIAGFISSFLSGYLAINFLLKYIKSHSLELFAYYRLLIGLLLIVVLIIK